MSDQLYDPADPATRAAFERFLDAATAFRARHAVHDRGGPAILVDLLTPDDPVNVLCNAMIAGHLQRRGGGRLIGLAATPLTGDQRRLAEALGIHEVHTLALDAVPDAGDLAGQVLGPLVTGDPDAFGFGLQKVRLRGVRVGDLIYDTWLRQTSQATLTGPDGDLAAHFSLACHIWQATNRVIDATGAGAVVLTDRAYVFWGVPFRTALARGLRAYVRRFYTPMTVQVYDRPDQEDDDVGRFPPAFFDAYHHRHGARAGAWARAFLGGDACVDGHPIGDEAARLRVVDRAALNAATGTAPDRPNVCIMAHVPQEAVHLHRSLVFRDTFAWLAATVAAAADHPDRNWLIKLHPDEPHYHPQVPTETLLAPLIADRPHIALVPSDVSTRTLFQAADGAVTAFGSAGFLFPAHGVPTLHAGDAPYAHLGFADAAQDRDDYFRRLCRLGLGGRLALERQARALTYASLFHDLSQVSCRFIPRTLPAQWQVARIDRIPFWTEAAAAMETVDPDQDPLARALAAHDSVGLPVLVEAERIAGCV